MDGNGFVRSQSRSLSQPKSFRSARPGTIAAADKRFASNSGCAVGAAFTKSDFAVSFAWSRSDAKVDIPGPLAAPMPFVLELRPAMVTIDHDRMPAETPIATSARMIVWRRALTESMVCLSARFRAQLCHAGHRCRVL